MCIASRVAAMFRSMSSCSGYGGTNPAGGRACDDDDADQDLPMLGPPPTLGLSRQETTRAATATAPSASSASYSRSSGFEGDGGGSPFPTVSERLKPQPFRRKDPPLHVQASVRGDSQELRKWLVSGGDANSRDEEGWALLHHASMHGREECVELLLEQGARHDQVAIGGHTVLHLASANRHCEVVKRLVEAGALVNARNAHGNAPLHSAAATGTIDVLSYLLSHSADPDAVNSVGETPDRVSGATPEAVHLLREARRLKQARIAQRFALVKIHKLWNSGRAEGVVFSHVSGGGPSHAGLGVSTCQISKGKETTKTAASRTETHTHPHASTPPAAVASTAKAAGAAAAAVGTGAAGSAAGGVVEEARAHEWRDCGDNSRDDKNQNDDREQESLGFTVAAIAGLPQEVLRRIVGYCTL